MASSGIQVSKVMEEVGRLHIQIVETLQENERLKQANASLSKELQTALQKLTALEKPDGTGAGKPSEPSALAS